LGWNVLYCLWWSECAECEEEMTNRMRSLEEGWCAVYPHLTDTFFHPSLLVAFVDKSERVAMASFSTV
jgi:hypothetical protein